MAPFLDVKIPAFEYGPDPPKDDPAAYREWILAREACHSTYKFVQSILKAAGNDPAMEMPNSTRASFGFQHANITLIDDEKLRFNPGLEDEAALTRYRDLFVDTDAMLQELKADLAGVVRDGKGAFTDIVKMDHGILSMTTLLAFRECRDVLGDVTASAEKKDAARFKMVQTWCNPQVSICQNPGGVQRLLFEISDAFELKQSKEIKRIDAQVVFTLDYLREPSADDRHLKAAKAAKDAGRLDLARQELVALDPQFAAEQTNADKIAPIQKWITDNAAAWNPGAEARITRASKAKDADDPVTVHKALDYLFSDAFLALRGDAVRDLKAWADERYSKHNASAALMLVRQADEHIEAGRGQDALKCCENLRWMIDSKTVGLPAGLEARLSEIERTAKLAAVKGGIASALRDAAEYEQIGNLEQVAKRLHWVDKALEAIGARVPPQEFAEAYTHFKELVA